MIKKTITYTDYDNVERTEDFYFNLSRSEVVDLEVRQPGGITAMLESIVKTKDSKKIVDTFKDIVQMSYGVKSPDGRRFIKSKELLDEFVQTEAYQELFMELASDEKAAAAFVNGIVPAPAK